MKPALFKSFKTTFKKIPVTSYKAAEIFVHVKTDLQVVWRHKKESINFEHALVFTRVSKRDAHMLGILYEHLRRNNIPASDPVITAYTYANGKMAQMVCFADAGIQVPQSIICNEISYAQNKKYILEHIQFPLVYKTSGNRGTCVFKINSKAELETKIAQKNERVLCMLQTLIPNTFDTRTLVAYGKVLGSIKRTAKKGQFLNNVSTGGRVSPYTLTQKEMKLAIRATKLAGLDFGGIDLIHTPEGAIVLEVNKSPQITGFEKVHGKNFVFKSIAALIEKQ